jgi:hypothetical protein
VVLQSDGGDERPTVSAIVRGAATIAKQALRFRAAAGELRPVLVNGAAGVLHTLDGRPLTLFAFTVRDDRIARIDILADRTRLATLPLPPA